MENSAKNEIIALRDQFCKHYDLGHGRRQAVLFPQAVHFRRGGAWREIDNRLIEAEHEGRRVWRNRDNPLQAMFARDGGAPMPVRIEYEGHSVEWGFAHGGAQAAEARLTVSYEAASDYDGTLFTGDGVYPALRVKALEEKAGAQGGVRLTFDYRHMSTHVTSVSGTPSGRCNRSC